jgi:hypothetical protein
MLEASVNTAELVQRYKELLLRGDDHAATMLVEQNLDNAFLVSLVEFLKAFLKAIDAICEG